MKSRVCTHTLAFALWLLPGCGDGGSEPATGTSAQCSTPESVAGFMNPDNPQIDLASLSATEPDAVYSLRFVAIGFDGSRAHLAQSIYLASGASEVEAREATCAANSAGAKQMSLADVDPNLSIPIQFSSRDGGFQRRLDLTFQNDIERGSVFTSGASYLEPVPRSLAEMFQRLLNQGAKVKVYRASPGRVYFTVEKTSPTDSSAFVYRILACYTDSR